MRGELRGSCFKQCGHSHQFQRCADGESARAVRAPPTWSRPSWWQAEGNAADAVGMNTGVLQNGTAFDGGEVGQAFRLDGVNDFISIPASASLNVGTGSGLTFECWMQP